MKSTEDKGLIAILLPWALLTVLFFVCGSVHAEGTVTVKDAAQGIAYSIGDCSRQAFVFTPSGPDDNDGNYGFVACDLAYVNTYAVTSWEGNSGVSFEEVIIELPNNSVIELHGCWLARYSVDQYGEFVIVLECNMTTPIFTGGFE
jgi:hypothetical protein